MNTEVVADDMPKLRDAFAKRKKRIGISVGSRAAARRLSVVFSNSRAKQIGARLILRCCRNILNTNVAAYFDDTNLYEAAEAKTYSSVKEVRKAGGSDVNDKSCILSASHNAAASCISSNYPAGAIEAVAWATTGASKAVYNANFLEAEALNNKAHLLDLPLFPEQLSSEDQNIGIHLASVLKSTF